jgi:hypothetical protein
VLERVDFSHPSPVNPWVTEYFNEAWQLNINDNIVLKEILFGEKVNGELIKIIRGNLAFIKQNNIACDIPVSSFEELYHGTRMQGIFSSYNFGPLKCLPAPKAGENCSLGQFIDHVILKLAKNELMELVVGRAEFLNDMLVDPTRDCLLQCFEDALQVNVNQYSDLNKIYILVDANVRLVEIVKKVADSELEIIYVSSEEEFMLEKCQPENTSAYNRVDQYCFY